MNFIIYNIAVMIDVQVRIHDRFVVEFKIGYVVRKDKPRSDFMINTWMFVPNTLDINYDTYTKNQFYRDVKSNIRLITPIYSLKEVANEEALPFQFLEVAVNELNVEATAENFAEAEYQVKMFCSITKSALRREVDRVWHYSDTASRLKVIEAYILRVEGILKKYRSLCELLPVDGAGKDIRVFHSFGDEFLSNQVDFYTFKLLERLRKKDKECFGLVEERLLKLVRDEVVYRRSRGFLVVERHSPNRNRAALFRRRMLRLYTESHLFLKADRKKDGAMVEQLYFSIAAGISMIFATLISFSFQQKYGNFTTPLFIALVVSYMLKDRIKELTRYYFVHRLAKKYFDNKTTISIKDKPIGWIKEGVDFITEDRVPEEVMAMRDRSDILEANNRQMAEKIILYRTLVRIDGQVLDENIQYDVSGVHNILRFNVSSFILKMENPEVPLAVPKEEGGYEIINGERIYYINYLLQLRSSENVDYKRFRLILSRNGIEGIEKM